MSETATAGPSGRALLQDGSNQRVAGVPTGITVLLIVASLVAFGGIATLSPATQGVGWMALACFLAILGRILQAGSHHKAMMVRQKEHTHA